MTGDESVAPAPPALGEGFARVHIPALDAAYAVVEGTRNEDLRAGPGHYVDTQMPGEPGNFALAGHRIGTGAVFQHLDRLDACDAVVVETEFDGSRIGFSHSETISSGAAPRRLPV